MKIKIRKCRTVMVFLLTAGLVAGLIFSFAFVAAGNNDLENRIQGAIAKLKAGSPAEQDIAEQQLKEIGLPALPQLMEVFREDAGVITLLYYMDDRDCLSAGTTAPYRGMRIVVSLGSKVVPDLVQIAGQDKDEGVCLAALKALAFLTIPKVPDVVPELIEVCQSNKWVSVRSKALVLLLTTEDKRILPLVQESLLNPEEYYSDHYDRIAAVRSLGGIEGKEAVPILLEVLKNDRMKLQAVAAEQLGIIGDIRAVPELINLLQSLGTKETDDWVFWPKTAAIWALGRMGDKRATGIIVESLLKDDNRNVRETAAFVLAQQLHDPQILGTLKEALADTNKDLRDRTFVAWVVASLGDSSGLPIIDEALKVGDRETKKTALTTLSYLEDNEAISRLIEALNNEDPIVQIGAAYFLLKKGNDDGTPIIFAHLHDQDFEIRTTAVMCLELMDETRAKPILLELVKDEDKRIQVIAAELLVEKGDTSWLPILDQALEDEDPEVRQIAYSAKMMREDKLKAQK